VTPSTVKDVRMIVVDLDGTLLRPDGSVSARTARALESNRSAGREIVFATGRPSRQVADIAEAAGHRGYCLCSNGAVLLHLETGRTIEERTFSRGAGLELVKALRTLDGTVSLAVETEAGLFAEPGFPAVGPAGVVADVGEVAAGFRQVLLHGDRSSGRVSVESLRKRVGHLVESSFGTPDGPLELTAGGVDKGTALRRLAAFLGIDAEQVVAFGDMPNDLAMLRWAGTSYAMANAHPEVLAAADRVAPGNAEDGVAAVLETLLPARRPSVSVTSPARLSFAITTHERRLAAAIAIRDRHPELDAEVVLDPDPAGSPQAMRTARVAWRTAPADASHRIVLQDDVTLCPGFLDAVHEIVAVVPRGAVSLFAEWGSRGASSLRQAALLGYGFAAVTNNYVPTQALIVPAGVARGFDAYVAEHEPDCTQDDLAMARYLERSGVDTRLSVPNLVEHSETTSLVGNDFMGRRLATCYAGSGLRGHRWDDRVFWPREVPFFCGRTELALCLIIAGEARSEWYTRTAAQLLAERGYGTAAHLTSLRTQLATSRHRQEITAHVDSAHLRECWSTAVLLGSAVAANVPVDTDPGDWWEEAIGAPWAAKALATLASGALRSFAPEHVLPAVQELLDVGVRQAFLSGTSVESHLVS
jgi:hydroxymethylpyrimidine pyrophosphatase-like HAD family hydrolase